MVKKFLFILAINITLPLFSQTCCFSDTDIVFGGGPEELPVFNKESPSIAKLWEFIGKNMVYPETAVNDKTEGRVVVRFCVNTDGTTSEHNIIRSVREDLDNEALRVAKLIKFDEPAKNRGKPVEFCFTLPITFSLSESTKSRRWQFWRR